MCSTNTTVIDSYVAHAHSEHLCSTSNPLVQTSAWEALFEVLGKSQTRRLLVISGEHLFSYSRPSPVLPNQASAPGQWRVATALSERGLDGFLRTTHAYPWRGP